MKEILNLILIIGALTFYGVFCAFFIILNLNKKEIWNKIYERMEKYYERRTK